MSIEDDLRFHRFNNLNEYVDFLKERKQQVIDVLNITDLKLPKKTIADGKKLLEILIVKLNECEKLINQERVKSNEQNQESQEDSLILSHETTYLN